MFTSYSTDALSIHCSMTCTHKLELVKDQNSDLPYYWSILRSRRKSKLQGVEHKKQVNNDFIVTITHWNPGMGMGFWGGFLISYPTIAHIPCGFSKPMTTLVLACFLFHFYWLRFCYAMHVFSPPNVHKYVDIGILSTIYEVPNSHFE